jgi:hypothetical protein
MNFSPTSSHFLRIEFKYCPRQLVSYVVGMSYINRCTYNNFSLNCRIFCNRSHCRFTIIVGQLPHAACVPMHNLSVLQEINSLFYKSKSRHYFYKVRTA